VERGGSASGAVVVQFPSPEPEAGDGRTITGYGVRYREPTTIDSPLEGRFVERMAPGAFADALRNPGGVKSMFQHGRDPSIGQKPLGPVDLREDGRGVIYETRVLATSYGDDVLQMAGAGLLGSSVMMRVREDEWRQPGRSATNPEGLPERLIVRADALEMGPVVFPAYSGTTTSVRGLPREVEALRQPRQQSTQAQRRQKLRKLGIGVPNLKGTTK
jgi:HK97 family phage prohead protease